MPLTMAFPEYMKRVKVGVHANLQLGDSLIAKHFELLLGSSWDIRQSKTVRSIYNDLIAGRLDSIE